MESEQINNALKIINKTFILNIHNIEILTSYSIYVIINKGFKQKVYLYKLSYYFINNWKFSYSKKNSFQKTKKEVFLNDKISKYQQKFQKSKSFE